MLSSKCTADAWSKYDEIVKADPESAYCKTGYGGLDKILGGGMFKAGLYIVGARPGMGKTTLGIGIAENIASRGKPVPNISIEAPKKCIATNTVDSMKSGAVFGTAAMIDGMIDRMEAELNTPVTVVATGGLSGSIIPYCRRRIEYEPDLLLKGLAILYQKNAKHKK